MRFGLVGTGFWARFAHAAGIQAAHDAELVAVFGRDAAKAETLANEFGAEPYVDFDAFLDGVDAVSFSVPPQVQARLAVRAAERGRHLLLEKPIATSLPDARALASAVDEAGVGSVVFFTACFTPERREWLDSMRAQAPWRGAAAMWLASAFAEGSPFDTPWRHEKGALWDVGPHIVAALTDALGPVADVLAAARGEGDLVHLVFRHESGATSTATATLEAAPAVGRSQLIAWNDSDVVTMPHSSQPPHISLSVAATELVAAADSRKPHPQDASYGLKVVELLAAAEALAARAPSG